MERITHSPAETEALAQELAAILQPGDVLAFRGGLGAGKTAFVRGLAQALTPDAEVSSPTFTLVNEYQGKLPLWHFDMYRITSLEDVASTGFFDYLEMGGVLAVEWSEHIEAALPENTIYITIDRPPQGGENDRIIIIDGMEGRIS